MQDIWKRYAVVLVALGIVALLGAACGEGEAVVTVETVEVVVTATPDPAQTAAAAITPTPIVVTATPDPAAAEVPAPTGPETSAAQGGGPFTTPHPFLSDVRVRQAIAYCTDRRALIDSVYPFLDEAQKDAMLMDTFIPQGHWAHTTEGITTYPFDPERGKQLLEEAGWFPSEWEGDPRVNEAGESLALKYTTTDAQFRITFSTVLQQQLMENCGIQIIRTHAPASWWFGTATGLQRRDFELGVFAWVGQADPSGDTLYACNQVPLPENNWNGQNYMGWCNEQASQAILAANNTLDRQERIEHYKIAQQEFSQDMVSLPLFNRFEANATTNNLLNFEPDISESSYVTNIHEWQMQDGSDTVIIGLTQKPSTLFSAIETSSVTQIVYDLISVRAATGKGYDFQPVALQELPSLENGLARLETVEVLEGDLVWSTSGESVNLAPGIEVVNANDERVVYEGGPLQMQQLVANFELAEGLTWEDGEPVKQADIELAYKINCDPNTGPINLLVCDSQQGITVTSDTTFTVTYLPGAKPPTYQVFTPGTFAGTSFTVGAYPSHRTLADGRSLADVPAEEWSSLSEIATNPLSYGPYRLVSWEEQRMVFEANPHYYLGEPVIKNVIVQFFDNTNAVVAQLLSGEVDVVGHETLGAGEELQSVIDAGAEGRIQFFPLTSATWEHMDMNLYVR
jgi:ABC-type transport system substrate-binding protein